MSTSSSSGSNTLLGALAGVAITVGVILWAFWYLRNSDLSRTNGFPGGGAPSFSDTRFSGPSPIDKLEDRLSEHETSSSSVDVADATPLATTKTDRTDAPVVAATSAATETTKTATAARPATSATISARATAKPQRVGLSAILGDEATGGDGQGHR
jgi:hypothetical protein